MSPAQIRIDILNKSVVDLTARFQEGNFVAVQILDERGLFFC